MKKTTFILTLVAFLVVITFIYVHLVNSAKFRFPDKDLYRIEIRNGTSGKLHVLDGEDALTFSNKLSYVDAKIIGLSGWSSGYRYKIEIFTKNGSDEIVIKSKNSFIHGIFKYESSKDIVELLEDEIKE